MSLQIADKCATLRAIPYTPPTPSFVPIRVNGTFLLEFDPKRGIIRLKRNNQTFTIDLADYENFSDSSC